MKVYESMALSRSGHHSMKNWVIKNLIGFQLKWEYKLIYADGTNFYHLGEANHDIPLSYKYLDDIKDTAEMLIINYEDTLWDYTLLHHDKVFYGPYRLSESKKYNIEHEGRIIYIRDFYNNLTSRIKSNERQIFKKWDSDSSHLFKTDGVFIERWKSHAKACVEKKVAYLKFEDWLNNEDARNKFLWDNFKVKDKYGLNGIRGSQSSFKENGDLNKRFEIVDIPEKTKDLIRKDNELHYLIGALGYEYKEI